MTSAQDAFNPALQNFLQAGQALAQGFIAYLGSQQGFVNSGGSAGQPGAGAPKLPPMPDVNELKAWHSRYLAEHNKLWQGMLQQHRNPSDPSANPAPYRVQPEPGDRRFSSAAWRESPVYDYMQQAYLINARFVKELVEVIPAEDLKAKDRLRFLARQYADAMAPTNFAATNPEFIQTALATQGKSITDGISNLVADMEKGRISMTDDSAFEVGRNIANSAGSVVFESELFQLIQYAPLTDKVGERPLLIVPPCINKFYILDLQPENSFVRYAVEQGNTVFLVSWRNPKAEQGHHTWDDYIEKAVIAAIRVVQEISGQSTINTLGFCVGGTVLASALGVLAARGEHPAESMTLLTTMLDFHDTGEIGLFIDEASVQARETSIGSGGLLTGRELSTTFSSLRANDLVWNYVASNYLKGQKPAAFDLLYWNSDSTNLPGPFAAWYMRNMYLDNALKDPGRLSMCGVRVDLSKLQMPAYLLATREDHIVPWQSAYRSTQVLGGDCRFVLGASGHIAGVINPASKNKRSHWLGGTQSKDAEGWFESAEERQGSWWKDWSTWLAEHHGKAVPAPKTAGSKQFVPIEPAPGRYVKEKA
jgi:polyhydroxyalkanoate synthase subunit PhaC